MAKYILVYEITDSIDMGGGVFTQEFGMDEQKLHKTVQALITENKDRISILYAGFLQVQFEYKAIEYAVRVEPKQVNN